MLWGCELDFSKKTFQFQWCFVRNWASGNTSQIPSHSGARLPENPGSPPAGMYASSPLYSPLKGNLLNEPSDRILKWIKPETSANKLRRQPPVPVLPHKILHMLRRVFHPAYPVPLLPSFPLCFLGTNIKSQITWNIYPSESRRKAGLNCRLMRKSSIKKFKSQIANCNILLL